MVVIVGKVVVDKDPSNAIGIALIRIKARDLTVYNTYNFYNISTKNDQSFYRITGYN